MKCLIMAAGTLFSVLSSLLPSIMGCQEALIYSKALIKKRENFFLKRVTREKRDDQKSMREQNPRDNGKL